MSGVSEEQGYVRVVNVRGEDEDSRAVPGERVIRMDRTNKVMGNPHHMKTQSRLERERLVEAHRIDLEADVKHKAPMHQTMMGIAFDIVDRGEKIAPQCF